MYFQPLHFIKTVADSGTPEALGASSVRLSSIQFIAEKAFGVANAGNITTQIPGTDGEFTDSKVITPGLTYTWLIPSSDNSGSAFYKASDFKIKVATNGDGVRVIGSKPAST